MLYLAISTPHPSKPEEVKNARLEFRAWIGNLKTENKVICSYPRVGRGSVVIVDVSSNEELHELLTQWSTFVPAGFDLYPLADPVGTEKLLK